MMQLNHHLPAFLYHYLQEKKYPTQFVKDLLQKSCDTTLFASIFACKWNLTEQVVTRPDDEELKRRKEEEQQNQQWYKDIINMHLFTTQKSLPKAHVLPKALYDLDVECAIGTINPHKKKKKQVKNTKAKTKAKSMGDSNSLGNDSSDLDSASKNASSKPFSRIGFIGKKKKADAIELSSSSDEEYSTNDSASQSSTEEGKGG